jgi:DNA-binding NarL/FixJ family response regulator
VTVAHAAISPVTSVTVLGGDTPLGTLALRILGAAGFTVLAAPAGDELGVRRGRSAAIAVVLGSGPAADRIAAVEAAAEVHEAVVAALPAGTARTTLRRALRAGASGLVLEDRLADTLAPTVRAVAAGQLAVPPALRRQLAPRALSHREQEVLAHVVLGYTNRQIADRLFVAESTVKTHLSSAFEKLEASSRAEAAALILDPEESYGSAILAIADAVGSAEDR